MIFPKINWDSFGILYTKFLVVVCPFLPLHHYYLERGLHTPYQSTLGLAWICLWTITGMPIRDMLGSADTEHDECTIKRKGTSSFMCYFQKITFAAFSAFFILNSCSMLFMNYEDKQKTWILLPIMLAINFLAIVRQICVLPGNEPTQIEGKS
ncbi:uncharacterized protein LOC129577177 isoform X2 [Sitodiplosis mosellana]|uniref:uncharacterized protein LOC129577177 isoform X2 n=1 Tax=Sitodiplosis mosellana TaxID=263140 RepID=UPI002443762C|nr:uncharacterized protein LOC129577177 isoform X2 [Sitodiplosis mosellana]